MKFTLDAGGAQMAGQGIGNIFKAYALGDQYRQQGEMDAMTTTARLGQAQAAARKYNADAALDEYKLGLQKDPMRTALIENQVPLDTRPVIEKFFQTGSFGPSYDTPADGVGPVLPPPVDTNKLGTIARAIAAYDKAVGTGSNVQQMAKAGETEQTMRDRAAITSNQALALPMAQAYFATSGKAPFDNVNNTGYSLNALTGGQFEANPVLAKLFGTVEQSKATENLAQAGSANASAGLSSARRDRVVSGLDKPVTIVDDETGQASITALPTRGDPRTIGLAPAKGTGVDATNAKTRNAIIAAVEKEMPGADEATITAEVTKRLARRGITGAGNKNPAPSANSPKIPSQSGQYKSADEVKAAFRAGTISREDATAILQRDFGMK
jgi:hypothetical protein